VGFNYHSFGYVGATRGGKVPASLYFDNAYPAAAGLVLNVEVLQFHVAERGDFDAYLGCCLQNRFAPLNGDGSIIYCQINHVHIENF
jgi:hypothetical protein